jgi:hypothetical protein
MSVLTIIWLPIITYLSDQVFVYIQSVQAYLSPPICVAYFAGVLCREKHIGAQGVHLNPLDLLLCTSIPCKACIPS